MLYTVPGKSYRYSWELLQRYFILVKDVVFNVFGRSSGIVDDVCYTQSPFPGHIGCHLQTPEPVS